MKKLFVAFLVSVLGAFSLPAFAQMDGGTFYAGGSLGRSNFVDVCSGVAGDCRHRDTDFSLFGGWQFSRYLGAEVGGRQFGHASLPTGNVKATAYELDAVATLPLYSRFSLVGRLGVFHGEMKGENIAERKNGGTFGWGAQYDVGPQFALRLEWQRYPGFGGGDFGAKTDIDSLALAAVLRFR